MSETSEPTFSAPSRALTVSPREHLRMRFAPPPEAGFVSQLIAEHFKMAAQSEFDRVAVGWAVGAYCEGTQRSVRRMPVGFRTSRSI